MDFDALLDWVTSILCRWVLTPLSIFFVPMLTRGELGRDALVAAAVISLAAFAALRAAPTPIPAPYRLPAATGIAVSFALVFLLAGDPIIYPAVYLVAVAAIVAWLPGDPPNAGDAFGSAKWADLDYLRAEGLVGRSGFRLGRVGNGGERDVLRYRGDRHLLTVAPNRSGKGVCAIVPNLLTYRGSALVIDPKGENALITSQARAGLGQTVHVVDPWGITGLDGVARFNPLDWLERGDVDITENAMLLADALIVPQSGGESFWREEAKALLQGFILYVATDEREAEQRHLGRVRDLLLLSGDDMEALFERMADSPHHVVASTGARSLQKEERLLASVIASAQAETHFLDSERMRDSLSASSFKFEDLKHQPMTIYLVLPADRLEAFGRWLRLLIQQAITVNARDIAAQPVKPVLFMLDELPALGKLSMIEQAFGLMAGFGIQLWAIAQDLSQLKRIYGASWESFIANAGVVQYFGSRDRMTAEYFSALCGAATVANISTSVSRGARSRSTSTTTASVQRKLAFPDELMRLDADKQLVFIENRPPIIAEKMPWFRDEAIASRGCPLPHAARGAA